MAVGGQMRNGFRPSGPAQWQGVPACQGVPGSARSASRECALDCELAGRDQQVVKLCELPGRGRWGAEGHKQL